VAGTTATRAADPADIGLLEDSLGAPAAEQHAARFEPEFWMKLPKGWRARARGSARWEAWIGADAGRSPALITITSGEPDSAARLARAARRDARLELGRPRARTLAELQAFDLRGTRRSDGRKVHVVVADAGRWSLRIVVEAPAAEFARVDRALAKTLRTLRFY
jgi:hypothetical protein